MFAMSCVSSVSTMLQYQLDVPDQVNELGLLSGQAHHFHVKLDDGVGWNPGTSRTGGPAFVPKRKVALQQQKNQR
jgi:hypothetical protein